MPFDLNSKTKLASAVEMVEAFICAGASNFTIVAERGEKEVLFTRRYCDADITLLNLRSDLILSEKEKCNLHIRPYSIHNTLVQLDDCKVKDIFPFRVYGSGPELEAITPFLITETSSSNYQVWLSIKGKLNDQAIKALKQVYLSDPGATGSCRIAGSYNFKEKHSPNFPLVQLMHTAKDAVIEIEDLAELELESFFTPVQNHIHREKKICAFRELTPGRKSLLNWPFYERALKLAPLRRDNSGIDRSIADYMWSLAALSWGHTVEAVANQLVRVSEKAREKNEYEALEYAYSTVLSAERNRVTD